MESNGDKFVMNVNIIVGDKKSIIVCEGGAELARVFV